MPDFLQQIISPISSMLSAITPEQNLVLVYLVVTLGIGLFRRSDTDMDSYLFAGRKLTIPAFVATLVTTWYGGILEIGRVSFQNGIVTWIIFGLFYYLAALIFLKYIAPKIHDNKVRTIPEFLQNEYGKSAAIFGLIFVFLIVSPAPYLKMLAVLFQHVWTMREIAALQLGALFSIIYAVTGGFSAIIRTDKLQFVLMFGGFIYILAMAVKTYGGITFLSANAPEYAFSIPGNFSWSYLLIWGFIAMVTFIDPGFYQRCFAGNSLDTVKKGIRLSIVFWLIFDFLTVFTGIYASAILPADITGNPYLELASHILPPLTKGIFTVSLFAIVMSTIDSFTFISAYTLGKDLPEIISGKGLKVQTMQLTQLAILLTAVISIFIAYWFPHAMDIWYTMGTFAVPVLLIPIVSAMYNRPVKYPVITMAASLLISVIWYFWGAKHLQDGWPVYPLGLEPLYPGLITSGLFYYFTTIRRK